MALFENLRNRLFGTRDPSELTISGVWQVTYISVPHPFAQYILELRADGSLHWSSLLPTTDMGEFNVSGDGTWLASGTELHYKSGEFRGQVRFSREGEDLVLDGLPATTVGPGVRCVLVKVQASASSS